VSAADIRLAIDFGTSNSLVGAWKDGKRVEALALDPLAADPTLMRTLLYFLNRDQCYYGAQAIKSYVETDMTGRLFRSFKSHLPNRNYLGTFIEDRVLTLESMIGIFLLEIKMRAERILKADVNSAVIGRPARYSLDPLNEGFAIHRMQKACEFAGFKSFELVPEPLAAAFDLRRNLKSEKLVLVGDFGGGTSDFTIIRMGPYKFEKDHVLGLEGCPLAGDALDSVFMSSKLNEFFGAKAKYKMLLGSNRLTMPQSLMDRINLPAHIVHLKEKSTYEFIKEVRKGALTPSDQLAIDRLLTLVDDQQIFSFFESIEKTKRSLSSNTKATFQFDYPGLEMEVEFLRTHFEVWAHEAKSKIFLALDECLRLANVSPKDIDMVCLTGGSAKVPLIENELLSRFGKEKLQTQSHFHSVLSGLIESASF
jgi:hypothetical chaperone protein